jgi:putative heme-binding domain-containing protein
MKRNRWLTLAFAATMFLGAAARAQGPAGQTPVVTVQKAPAEKNPYEGDKEAIQAGMGQFRVRCADCHGMDATGVRGPDITQVWASGRSDGGLFLTLRNGVANTEMPSVGVRTTDHEIWQILAYLRTLAAPAATDPPRGNAENGERLFRANCASCHRVNNRGGRLGPDLSRIGNARSREVMVRRIRGAIEENGAGYAPVTLTTPSGQQVQAVKKNEDLFSVQVMDSRERIQGYVRSDLKEVKDETRSAMPPFGTDRLSESQLDDVVRYLQTLKGFDPTVK